MKVGDTVWIFDPNHREYTEPEAGRIWGTIIYRAHFRPVQIVSETKVSWVLQDGRKVNKKTLAGIYPSQTSVDDAIFLHDHAYKIGDAVRNFKDPAALRTIAGIVGYDYRSQE